MVAKTGASGVWRSGRVWLAVLALLFFATETLGVGHKASHDPAKHGTQSCALCAVGGAPQLPATTADAPPLLRLAAAIEFPVLLFAVADARIDRPRSRSPPLR